MTPLRTLAPEARRLVTHELASGIVVRWPERAWRPLAKDTPRPIDLGAFDAIVDEMLAKFEPFDTAIDAWIAPRLHRALGLTRREAADPGVWRYLAVVHRPDFLRHRWENRSWAVTRSRFWSTGTRHTSNPFGRLHWIAELTRDGDDYTLTERTLSRPALANPLFDRGWSAHRPAVEACVDLLAEAPAETIERTARDLSRHLGTVPLEFLDTSDLRRVLARMIRQPQR